MREEIEGEERARVGERVAEKKSRIYLFLFPIDSEHIRFRIGGEEIATIICGK